MSVPANAEIWFDGAKTKQTGPSREFVSTPLAPDRSYTYHLRVRWTEDGRTIERTRRVPVRAGDRIRLDFTDGRSAQPYDYGAFPLGDQY